MTPARAIIIGSLILSATTAIAVHFTIPRYSLANIGDGHTVRLDRTSGDMIGCTQNECAPIVAGNKVLFPAQPKSPPPPPGFH